MERHLLRILVIAVFVLLFSPLSAVAQEVVPPEQVSQAVKMGDLVKLKKLLAQGGDLFGVRDASGNSAVQLAVSLDNVEIVEFLFSRGVKPESQNSVSETLLVTAARANSLKVARILLEKGVLAQGKSDVTPLHIASAQNNIDMMKLLFEFGAWVDPKDDQGLSPLFMAAESGQYEAVVLLLESGADLKAAARGKWTCLHSAASSGNTQLVELFLSRGADPRVRAFENQKAAGGEAKTPEELARQNGHKKLARLLRKARKKR